MKKVILASSSPRRKELLEQLKIPFTVHSIPVDENIDMDVSVERVVEILATHKAQAVVETLSEGLVIGADTLVTLEGQALGKPRDRDEAIKMLNILKEKEHVVYTGVALIDAETRQSIVTYESTVVKFRKLSAGEIEAYVKTGEPMDKAGAYGVQGLGALFIQEIEGCYHNVVGLPVAKLPEMFKQFDIDLTAFWNTCSC